MSRIARMGVLCALLAWAACGDNHSQAADDDAAPTSQDASPGDSDAGPDAGPQALRHCLASPNDLSRPPSDQLPCELLPPGFGS